MNMILQKLRNRFKLVRMVYLDLVYFAGVKNLSTQFRDDMQAAFSAGVTLQIIGDEPFPERESFNKWFEKYYL
jgi:hypothetical protein